MANCEKKDLCLSLRCQGTFFSLRFWWPSPPLTVAAPMPNFIFSSGSISANKDGLYAGEKRARTEEMCNVGRLDMEESAPPLPPLPISFKDKVAGFPGMAEGNFEIGEDDFVIKKGTIPSIHFSDKIKECLYRPWRTAVIIKLMGRPLTYNFLRTRLLQRWQLKGPMSLIDLENNYFIVKFVLEEDKRYVLTGGPWQIAGQNLVTQNWKPGFDPKEERITHMMAWVRINGLNVEYFRTDVMEKIGKLLGHTVKVDALTMGQARGKFARLCVEIDLSEPLTPFVEVEGRTYGVVYEGIQLVCFECGCYGHGKDTCPTITKAKTQDVDPEIPKNVEVHTPTEMNGLDAVNRVTTTVDKPTQLHGQWMLMKPRGHKKKAQMTPQSPDDIQRNSKLHGGEADSVTTGSRFAVLDVENSTGRDVEEEQPINRDREPGSQVPTKAASGTKKSNVNSRNNTSGKLSSSARDPKIWVFKKPLKDVTNKVFCSATLNPGIGARKPVHPKLGSTNNKLKGVEPVGLQVKGADVQDDVHGIFSFNVDPPCSSRGSMGKMKAPHNPEPPDIVNMDVNEGDLSVAAKVVDFIHNNHDVPEQGLATDLFHDATASILAENVTC